MTAVWKEMFVAAWKEYSESKFRINFSQEKRFSNLGDNNRKMQKFTLTFLGISFPSSRSKKKFDESLLSSTRLVWKVFWKQDIQENLGLLWIRGRELSGFEQKEKGSPKWKKIVKSRCLHFFKLSHKKKQHFVSQFVRTIFFRVSHKFKLLSVQQKKNSKQRNPRGQMEHLRSPLPRRMLSPRAFEKFPSQWKRCLQFGYLKILKNRHKIQAKNLQGIFLLQVVKNTIQEEKKKAKGRSLQELVELWKNLLTERKFRTFVLVVPTKKELVQNENAFFFPFWILSDVIFSHQHTQKNFFRRIEKGKRVKLAT